MCCCFLKWSSRAGVDLMSAPLASVRLATPYAVELRLTMTARTFGLLSIAHREQLV